MFTIKHVQPSGHEEIMQARRVNAFSGGNVAGEITSVFYEPEDNRALLGEIVEGTVYVMNDNGKTVAIYRLKYPDLKQPGPPTSFGSVKESKE